MTNLNQTVKLGWDTLGEIGNALKPLIPGRTVVIVTQATIPVDYAQTVMASCDAAGFQCHQLIVPDGESAKSLSQASDMLDQLLAWRLDRYDALIALGGGVVGDLTGFVAAIYLRGIRVIQVPTTVLSQVDAAIGGKTGVNHAHGKNLIGAFHQPTLVYAAIKPLMSLPARQVRSGLAEVVKYGIITDPGLIQSMTSALPDLKTAHVTEANYPIFYDIIRRSADHKCDVVSQDEREAQYRMILNFGHTIGHAIEAYGGYKTYSHGEAIAIGMILETKLAVQLGYCDTPVYDTLYDVLTALGLPTHCPLDPVALMSSMRLDKKNKQSQIRFVFPTKIGETTIVTVPDTVITDFLLHAD